MCMNVPVPEVIPTPEMIPDNQTDNSSFDGLFHAHYSWLCYCAEKVTRDVDMARDIVQDFFVYYWSNRKNISLMISFKAYATRAVLNLSASYLKKERLQEKYLSQLAVTEDDVDDSQQVIEEEHIFENVSTRLLEAISDLPVQRKKILVLHQFGKLKYVEIADRLGISKNTVKTHLKLAYKVLKEKMHVKKYL